MQGVGDMGKVTTGVKHLDTVLGGGFERGSVIDIAGEAGTGKSTFGLQFAAEGAKKGERVLYVSFEESSESLRRTAHAFGWELEKHADIKLVEISPFNFDKAFRAMLAAVRKHRPERIVLDTATSLALYVARPKWKAAPGPGSHAMFFVPTPGDVRRALYELIAELRKSGSTILLLSEEENDFHISNQVLKFISDGVIRVANTDLGTRVSRTLEIVKMRRIAHPLDRFPMEIAAHGISISPLEG